MGVGHSPIRMTNAHTGVSGAREWHARIWKLTWPILIANISIPLVGAVDTAIMGRMPDASFVAAVAVGATVFSAIYWSFGFLRMGTTGLMAQAWGANNASEVVAIAIRALIVAVAVAAVLFLARGYVHDFVLSFFNITENVNGLASSYFLIRTWSIPAVLIHFVVLGVLFALQKMRETLILSVLLNVSNIILDYLFVIQFGWGVEGVAWGTVISEWFGVLVGLGLAAHAIKSTVGLPPFVSQLWQGAKWIALVGISTNLIIRSFMVQLPFFMFTVFGSQFGTVVLAANAILMQYFILLAYGLDGFAHTAETLAGRAFGAKDRDSFRATTRYSSQWAFGLACLIALFFGIFSEGLIALMTNIDAVKQTALDYMPWVVVSPLLCVGAFQMDGIYIGATQTRVLRNYMLVAVICYGLTIWWALPEFGNHGLWLAMMLFMLVRSITLIVHYPRLERQLTQASA